MDLGMVMAWGLAQIAWRVGAPFVARYFMPAEIAVHEDPGLTFFFTPDDDRNDPVNAHLVYTGFRFGLVLVPTYPVEVSEVRVYALHPMSRKWSELLDDKSAAGSRFPLTRDWLDSFEKGTPKFQPKKVGTDEACTLQFRKYWISAHRSFEHGSPYGDWFYANVLMRIRCNSSNLFVYLLVPEMISSVEMGRARIVDRPIVYRIWNQDEAEVRATGMHATLDDHHREKSWTIWHRLR